jgi:hypothetical protein
MNRKCMGCSVDRSMGPDRRRAGRVLMGPRTLHGQQDLAVSPGSCLSLCLT